MTLNQRTILIASLFLAVLVAGVVGQTALASPAYGPAQPTEGQNTIPPNTDTLEYGLFLPLTSTIEDDGHIDDIVDGCPTRSDTHYQTLQVVGPAADHPAAIHGDLNLSLRSYVPINMPLSLVDINGPTDSDAPQFANVTGSGRPDFVAAYQVNNWDWGCTGDVGKPWQGHGCRGDPIAYPPVTLLGMATDKGAPIRAPSRHAEIHAGGYIALVLYAEESRLTLAYTREDTAARGYVIHLEEICVDPALLQLYRQLDAAGRSSLPALHSLEQLGTGTDKPMKAAIRDTGSFMDPRSRKDWWKGF